ncbi:MAG: hypothetical protein ABFC77_14645 [Thermoguttaceae bacterium]
MLIKTCWKTACLLASVLVLSVALPIPAEAGHRAVPAFVYAPGYAAYPSYAYVPRRAYRAARYSYPAVVPSAVYVPGQIYGYPYYGYANPGYLHQPSVHPQPQTAMPQPTPSESANVPTLAPEQIPAPPNETEPLTPSPAQ